MYIYYRKDVMKRVLMTGTLILALIANAHAADILQEANDWYARRGTNFDSKTLKADSTYIQEALDLYLKAFEQFSGVKKEEACWKLIRACYFKGQFVETENDAKKRVFDLGKNVGAEGLKEFSESVGIHAWMAIIWGVWGEENGIIQSARKGVAGRIREHCEKVIERDKTFQDATGYRVLGRLHFKAPKIPLILSWPSKEKAVEYLEKAHRISSQNLYTKQYLAEALYERGQEDRAKELLREILATNEIVLGIVEDAVIKRNSLEILHKWEN